MVPINEKNTQKYEVRCTVTWLLCPGREELLLSSLRITRVGWWSGGACRFYWGGGQTHGKIR